MTYLCGDTLMADTALLPVYFCLRGNISQSEEQRTPEGKLRYCHRVVPFGRKGRDTNEWTTSKVVDVSTQIVRWILC